MSSTKVTNYEKTTPKAGRREASVLRDDNTIEGLSCRGQQLKKDFIAQDRAFLIFTQKECLPCAQLIQNLSSQDKEVPGSFYLIDTDNCPKIADEFQVKSTPTVIITSKGKETKRLQGVTNIDFDKLDEPQKPD